MPAEFLTIKAIAATFFLVLLWTAEGVWPMFLGREQRTAHYARNVALGILNALVVSIVFAGGLLLVSEHAGQAGFGLLHWLGVRGPLAWILALVVFDAWQYAWHVMNHRIPLLWRFHAVHHSDAEMDASTALRFHTGEIVLSASARLLVLPALGMSMMHLAVYETVLLPIVLFHHSNVKVPPRLDKALRLVVVTPWMHWVHHSDFRPETDSNYASIFSIWDRLFQTFRLRSDPATIALGLKGFTESEWRSLSGMIRTPLFHEFRSVESKSADRAENRNRQDLP